VGLLVVLQVGDDAGGSCFSSLLAAAAFALSTTGLTVRMNYRRRLRKSIETYDLAGSNGENRIAAAARSGKGECGENDPMMSTKRNIRATETSARIEFAASTKELASETPAAAQRR
jgi:hypothetical protein